MYDVIQKGGLKESIIKEIETLWYGLREFKVKDPDGYVWTINTPVSELPSSVTRVIGPNQPKLAGSSGETGSRRESTLV